MWMLPLFYGKQMIVWVFHPIQAMCFVDLQTVGVATLEYHPNLQRFQLQSQVWSL